MYILLSIVIRSVSKEGNNRNASLYLRLSQYQVSLTSNEISIDCLFILCLDFYLQIYGYSTYRFRYTVIHFYLQILFQDPLSYVSFFGNIDIIMHIILKITCMDYNLNFMTNHHTFVLNKCIHRAHLNSFNFNSKNQFIVDITKQRRYTFVFRCFRYIFPNVNIRFYYIMELKSFYRKFGVLEHRH